MAEVTAEPFGATEAGTPVHRVTLQAGALRAAFVTYGARLQDLRLDGHAEPLTQGGSVADYETRLIYQGAIVGPVANRIGGATAIIDGQPCRFDANEGLNTLHGGLSGLHARVWQIKELAPDAVTFALDLADGDGGFPGNRRLTARYAIERPATLALRLTAETDAPTPLNLANHSYWRLGEAQKLRVEADHYLPTDTEKLPTGDVTPVKGTRFDLRQLRPIGGQGYDHCFCIAEARRAPAFAAELIGGGLAMTLETTEPGLQVFDGLPEGVALEPQGWPDAPNRPSFPSVILGPYETYQQVTRWTFVTATSR